MLSLPNMIMDMTLLPDTMDIYSLQWLFFQSQLFSIFPPRNKKRRHFVQVIVFNTLQIETQKLQM